MGYLSSLLRQSGAKIEPARPGLRRTDRIEVDDVRVVAPSESAAGAPGASRPPATVPDAAVAPPIPLGAAPPTEAAGRLARREAREATVEPPPAPTRAPRASAPEASSPAVAPPEAPPQRVSAAPDGPSEPGAPPPQASLPRLQRRTSTPGSPTEGATRPRGPEHVLRQVADVVAWVAAGAEAEGDAEEHPAATPTARPMPPAVEPRLGRAAQPLEPTVLRRAPALESGEVTVSIGTIDVTVEAPETGPPHTPIEQPRPPVAADAPDTGPRLTRHYLRA
jgi:hypothetical protein